MKICIWKVFLKSFLSTPNKFGSLDFFFFQRSFYVGLEVSIIEKIGNVFDSIKKYIRNIKDDVSSVIDRK